MVQSGKLRHVDARIMRGAARIPYRRDFIFHKRIVVERKPFPKPRNAVAEIKGGAAVTGIIAPTNGVVGAE